MRFNFAFSLTHYIAKYRVAAKAEKDTGWGVTDTNIAKGITTVAEKLDTMCLFFERMDVLFGSRDNVAPCATGEVGHLDGTVIAVREEGINDYLIDGKAIEDAGETLDEFETFLPELNADASDHDKGEDPSTATPKRARDSSAAEPATPTATRPAKRVATPLKPPQLVKHGRNLHQPRCWHYCNSRGP